MPDQHQPAESSTTIPASGRGKPRPSSATSPNRSQDGANHTVHLVLGSKGGVGKSHVASLVAQHLQERGRPLACIDADVLNETLSDLKALRAAPVHVLNGDGEV